MRSEAPGVPVPDARVCAAFDDATTMVGAVFVGAVGEATGSTGDPEAGPVWFGAADAGSPGETTPTKINPTVIAIAAMRVEARPSGPPPLAAEREELGVVSVSTATHLANF